MYVHKMYLYLDWCTTLSVPPAVAMQRTVSTQSSTCCFINQFSKHCFLVSKHLTFLFVLLTVFVFLSIASCHIRCCKVWCRKPVFSLAGDTHTHTHTHTCCCCWSLFRDTSGLIFPFWIEKWKWQWLLEGLVLLSHVKRDGQSGISSSKPHRDTENY